MTLRQMIELLEDKVSDTYTVVTVCGGKRTEEQRPARIVKLSYGDAMAILDTLKEYADLREE